MMERMVWPASIIAVFMVTMLGGCSSTMPSQDTSAQKQMLATFDVSQCQSLGVDIYRCPAVDKPICGRDYVGPLECLRIGKNGGVYVGDPTP